MERQGPARLPGRVQGARPHPGPRGPPDLPLGQGPAPDDLGAGRRGRGGPRPAPPSNVWEQQGVAVEGQTDILTMGLPYISPYNVNSIMNPILVACLGLGYFFNLYRGKPLVREGGVLIMTHPTPWEFNPVHHPSYIDFFEQVLSRDDRPDRGGRPVRGVLRHRPVVHPPLPHRPRLPRRPPLLHVVLVRPRPPAPRRGDRRRAATAPPCAASASGRHPPWPTRSRWPRTWSGPSPSLTHLHAPPDPDGRRAVTATKGSVQLPASAAGGGGRLGPRRRHRPRPRRRSPRPAVARRPWPRGSAGPVPAGRAELARVGTPAAHPSPSSASTTTRRGRGGTRCAWPGPWCSTT